MDTNSQFYVLQVPAGRELAVQARLLERGLDARVPRELCTERRRGTWQTLERILLPCYVFTGLPDMNADTWHFVMTIARAVCAAPRFLGAGSPQPITEPEAEHLGFLAPDEKPLPPSVVAFDAFGTPRIVSGPLLGLGKQVQRYDKRQQRALVQVSVLGETKTLRMAIIEKADREEML